MTDRRTYYNPMLDPHCQGKMTEKMRAAVQEDKYVEGGPLNEPDADHPANLVSSLCDDGLHRPALDLDLSAALFPSTTPGHYHLYLDVAMEWDAYVTLLQALSAAGILEQKYVDHSIARGQTLLRPPGVRKHWAPASPPQSGTIGV